MHASLKVAVGLALTGALAAQGSFVKSGNGCAVLGCNANAIYQEMAAGAWDLDGRAILFQNDGISWIARPGPCRTSSSRRPAMP